MCLSVTSPCSGIINPIEAKQRKGKGAVGAYGSERTTQSLQDFPVADSEEEAEEVLGRAAVWVARALDHSRQRLLTGLWVSPHTCLCGRPCWGLSVQPVAECCPRLGCV